MTFAGWLSPAALLAVTTRVLEEMLDREQDSIVVLHSCFFGDTLSSYRVYAVANTEEFHETVAKELLPLYINPDGGQGAVRGNKKWVNAWDLYSL